MGDCVFCKIVAGSVPCQKILETESHLAFLSIFPNTTGFTVVIPKAHLTSDVLALDDSVYTELMLFAKRVDKALRKGLEVDRCALISEGMMINHAHVKLIPLHGLNGRTAVVCDDIVPCSEKYEGYVTSKEGPRQSDEELALLAQKIRNKSSGL